MYKSFFSFIIFLANFSAYSDDEFQWQKIDKQAIKDAEDLNENAHHSYLQCYPLDQQSKKECVQQLNDQYIIKTEYKSNPQYRMTFQYKAEKLGFLKFLQNHNLLCSGIDHGPKFAAAKNAYQVDCICSNSYQVQFDYRKKEWHLSR